MAPSRRSRGNDTRCLSNSHSTRCAHCQDSARASLGSQLLHADLSRLGGGGGRQVPKQRLPLCGHGGGQPVCVCKAWGWWLVRQTQQCKKEPCPRLKCGFLPPRPAFCLRARLGDSCGPWRRWAAIAQCYLSAPRLKTNTGWRRAWQHAEDSDRHSPGLSSVSSQSSRLEPPGNGTPLSLQPRHTHCCTPLLKCCPRVREYRAQPSRVLHTNGQ